MNDNCTFRNQNLPNIDWKNHNKLREAIRTKQTNLVRQLINSGAQVNIGARCSSSFHSDVAYHHSPLHWAVVSRSPEIIEILLDNGAKVCVEAHKRDTPLTLAAKTNNNVIIDLLLSYDVQHHQNSEKLSHFHIACMRNKIDVVKKLLLSDQGTTVNEPVGEDSMIHPGFTALHFAVQFGCVETVELLLKSGADITAKDSRQLTPLHLAHFQRHEEIIDLILAAHIYEYTNPVDDEGLSHFHIACTRNNVLIVEHFLKLDININRRASGWNAIHFAIFYECPDVLDLLLKFQVQLNTFTYFPQLLESAFIMKNERIYDSISKAKRSKFDDEIEVLDRISKLHIASIENDLEGMSRLILNDAAVNDILDLNAPTTTGATPLHLAVRHKSQSVIDFLLGHGANLMAQDSRGKTPLHIAFEKEYFDVTHKIGKNLTTCTQNLVDEEGLSLFHILCTTGRMMEVIKNLLLSVVDINAPVGDESLRWAGFTPLHFAVKFQQCEVIEFLLERGANIYNTDKLNHTPLDLSVENLFGSSRTYYFISRSDTSSIFLMIHGSIPFENRWQYCQQMNGLHSLCIIQGFATKKLEPYVVKHPYEINMTVEYPQSRLYHKCTPLHFSLMEHKYGEAKMLLENGADPLIVNENGLTPLEQVIWASGSESTELESLYLTNMNVETFKPSHFHVACVLGLVKVAKLLEDVSDPHIKRNFLYCLNDRGQTPLHSLCIHGRMYQPNFKEVAQLLLQNGADVSARDFELQTPLHYTHDTDVDIMQLFVDAGADVNEQNLFGEILFHKVLHNFIADFFQDDELEYAEDSVRAFNLREKIVFLLENGSDINLIDELGRTCLTMMNRLDLHENSVTWRECTIIMLKHVQKLRVIGSPICEKNEQAYVTILERFNGTFDEASFFNTCSNELELMRSRNIDNSTTLHDIMFKNLNGMTFHCESTELQEIVNSDVFMVEFPIYGYLIRLLIKKGRIRRPLLRKCREIISNVICQPLPNVCIEMILRHLSNTDLSNLIAS